MRPDEPPVFSEPWEARVFALAVALSDRGLFTWTEWSAALATEIDRARSGGDPDTGETAYHHWVATLERLTAGRGLTA